MTKDYRYPTENHEQLKNALLPAYERELAAAKERGDESNAKHIAERIDHLRKHLGLDPVRTATKKAPEKRAR